MSHQSGITATPDLQALFAHIQTAEDVRVVKVSIIDEQLAADGTFATKGTWEQDYDAAVLSLIQEDHACYLLYRLDSKNSFGNNFVFIVYSPDFAHVREKMLYASTRSTIKSLFGLNYISDELFGTLTEDVSLQGYKKHQKHTDAPPPMTNAELNAIELKQRETTVHIGTSTKKTVSTGVEFPLDEAATEAVVGWLSGASTFVALNIDFQTERIVLANTANTDVDSVAAFIPEDAARYILFRYNHSHEGDQFSTPVFVYSCPGYKCSIKERMLYASCKGPLLDSLEQQHGISFEKKLEIGGKEEFSQEFLYEQLHPKQQAFTQKFARPKRPGKGGVRLTTRSSTSSTTQAEGQEAGEAEADE